MQWVRRCEFRQLGICVVLRKVGKRHALIESEVGGEHGQLCSVLKADN